MSYILPADFRAATTKWYTLGLTKTSTEASDAQLTDAIKRASDLIDHHTNDHYEPEASMSIDVDGSGTSILRIPKRIRSVSLVETRDLDGVLTTEVASSYRVIRSLDSTGLARVGSLDAIAVVKGRRLVDGSVGWPIGLETVRVTGTFSWGACPEAIKEAVALLVFDMVSPKRADLHRAEKWETKEHLISVARTIPTGIPRVDQVIDEYRRVD